MKTRTLKSLCAAVACVFALAGIQTPALAQAPSYQIYPTPHSTVIQEQGQVIPAQVQVIKEAGIDADTQARLDIALRELGATGQVVANPTATNVHGTAATTTVLLGVKGSGGVVDKYVDELVKANEITLTQDLFTKTDAYVLASLPANSTHGNLVVVLGSTTDAVYYGLTTLYQIFQQLDGATLAKFTICDYADVITRGFIEGYYGNPWSTEDRVNLMTWGGYYKLNAYVYAPKDDPKHNAQWRVLYTEEELKNKIEPLAKAGNESKCRFVFALHPFMNSPITNRNYDESVVILKQKFTQVMDHGVRQISILADDASNQGAELYTKLLKDMTDWLHQKQKEKNADGTLKYPGLKDTLIFCPVNYMGWGENWYANLPSTVQVVNTGGRVWGKVDNHFVSSFKNNSGGVAPFMWINWPCSDNDKSALHMGGHENFLGSDLTPGSVEGIVLNPMQQSEPSKQGIFMNADLCWNLWQGYDRATKAWSDSFSYIDHNSPAPTVGSNALKELSGHMLRMYGGGATWTNNESAAIKDTLISFRQKLASDSLTKEDIASLRSIFTGLQITAQTYGDNAGNPNMKSQMEPWIATWKDLTEAALLELDAAEAALNNNASTLVSKYAQASTALAKANNHGFWYVNYTEYARVGKDQITPTVEALAAYVAKKARLACDPNANEVNVVTSRTDTPTASTDVLLDGKANTGLSYKTPASVSEGTYLGVVQTREITLNRFTITYDATHPNDTLRTAKLQVLRLVNGQKVWQDVSGKTVSNSHETVVDFRDLNETHVYGARLITTAANDSDCWLTVNELELNKVDAPTSQTQVFTGTVTTENLVVAGQALNNASDNNTQSEAWFKKGGEGSDRDTTPQDAAVVVTFANPVAANQARFAQGSSNSGDVIDSGRIEARYEGSEEWVSVGTVNRQTSQTFALDNNKRVTALRVVNGANKAIWWRVADLTAASVPQSEIAGVKTITTNISRHQENVIAHAIDGNNTTKFWSNRTLRNSDWIMLSFGKTKTIDTVRILQGGSDCFNGANILYTTDATPNATSGTWKQLATANSNADQVISTDRVEATAIKLAITNPSGNWFQLFEFDGFEKYAYTQDNIYTNFKANLGNANARVGGGVGRGAGSFVELPQVGNIVALDLGTIRREVKLAGGAAQIPANTQLVTSINGVEWTAAEAGAAGATARYVGFKATAAGASVDPTKLNVTYLDSLEPRLVKSDIAGAGEFDAKLLFDGKVSTTSSVKGMPAAGNCVVIDLGQERTINTLEYFVPETSKDFIRNAVIEVAATADAGDRAWTQVLDINSKTPVDNTFNEDTAKNATWLTHSSTYPGNMMISSADQEGSKTGVKGRYLRIRFTAPYSHRWVCVGELRINNGEQVSTYSGGKVESTHLEQAGTSPLHLSDNNLSTIWTSDNNAAGKLTYHVETPLQTDGTPYQGIRIISYGAPSGARVSADLYTDDTFTHTQKVELGTLSQPSQEFSLGNPNTGGLTVSSVSYSALKSVYITWDEGKVPALSEVYLLDSAAAANDTLVAELTSALNTAKSVDSTGWISAAAQSLSQAITQAEAALAKPASLTEVSARVLISQLTSAAASPVVRYAGTQLADAVAAAESLAGDKAYYTKDSWGAYEAAVSAAKTALANAANLTQEEGVRLLAALEDARGKLEYSSLVRERVGTFAASFDRSGVDDVLYTQESRDVLAGALANLDTVLGDKGSAPTVLTSAQAAVEDAQAALVKVSDEGAGSEQGGGTEEPSEPGEGTGEPVDPGEPGGGTEEPSEPGEQGGTDKPVEPGKPGEQGGTDKPAEQGGGTEEPAKPSEGTDTPGEPGGTDKPAESGRFTVSGTTKIEAVAKLGGSNIPANANVVFHTQELTSGVDYDKLKEHLGDLSSVYNLTLLVNGNAVHNGFGSLLVKLPVDAAYNGSTFKVAHLHEDGTITSQELVAADGFVSLELTDLSSVGVSAPYKQASEQGGSGNTNSTGSTDGSGSQGNATTSNDKGTNGTGSSSANTKPSKAKATPQTSDPTASPLGPVAAGLVLIAAGIAARKHKGCAK